MKSSHGESNGIVQLRMNLPVVKVCSIQH